LKRASGKEPRSVEERPTEKMPIGKKPVE